MNNKQLTLQRHMNLDVYTGMCCLKTVPSYISIFDVKLQNVRFQMCPFNIQFLHLIVDTKCVLPRTHMETPPFRLFQQLVPTVGAAKTPPPPPMPPTFNAEQLLCYVSGGHISNGFDLASCRSEEVLMEIYIPNPIPNVLQLLSIYASQWQSMVRQIMADLGRARYIQVQPGTARYSARPQRWSIFQSDGMVNVFFFRPPLTSMVFQWF